MKASLFLYLLLLPFLARACCVSPDAADSPGPMALIASETGDSTTTRPDVLHPEERLHLTRTLYGQLMQGHEIETALSALRADERTAYEAFLLEQLDAAPDCSAWEEHLNWQQTAHILYVIDPDTYRARIRRRAISAAETCLAPSGMGPAGMSDDLTGLRRHVLALYKARIAGAPGVDSVAQAALGEVEQRLKDAGTDPLHRLLAGESDRILATLTMRRKDGKDWLHRHLGDRAGFRVRGESARYVRFSGSTREVWMVQMDPVLPGDGFLTFRAAGDPDRMVTVRTDEFLSIDDKASLDALLDAASAGEHDAADLPAFDVPRDGRIAYLRFMPRAYGDVEFGFLLNAFVRAAAFEQRYGARFSARPVVFTNDLVTDLRHELERARDAGASTVIIELSSHGSPEGFRFGQITGPEDVVDVLRAFPDLRFVIRTPACYGGRLRQPLLDAVAADSGLAARVSFFAQTSPAFPNVLFYGKVLDSSVYDLFFLQNLFDPGIPTYGEAARRAERMARQIYWTDAEAVVNGRLIQ